MVRHGIIRKLLPKDNDVLCLLNDPATAPHARQIGNTRSAAQIDRLGKRIAGAVVAIGNAPTALFRLLESVAAGNGRPAVVLGFPVGFVGAAESKQALGENDLGLDYITVSGRRGGSAMASAAVNALAGGSAPMSADASPWLTIIASATTGQTACPRKLARSCCAPKPWWSAGVSPKAWPCRARP